MYKWSELKKIVSNEPEQILSNTSNNFYVYIEKQQEKIKLDEETRSKTYFESRNKKELRNSMEKSFLFVIIYADC